MKEKFILLISLLVLVVSCDKTPKVNYKYSDQPDLYDCSEIQEMELIKESVYAFESFIVNNYAFRHPGDVEKAYINFLRNAESNLIPMAELFDDHMKAIVSKLKNTDNLWVHNGEEFKFNFQHPLAKCIGNNLDNDQFKSVYNALVSSNTYKTTLVAPSIREQAYYLNLDRALTTLVAMDMFYSKVMELDLSLSKEELSEQIRRINEEHVGHNH